MVTDGNFTGQTTPDVVDTEYVRCNFSQAAPVNTAGIMTGVRLFPGNDAPRTFRQCNLCNCEPPPGSTLIDCNTTIKEFAVSTGTDDVVIDGVSLVRTTYVDRVYGRYDSIAGYEYLGTPRDESQRYDP